jgi:hypothetical protein
MSNGTSIAKQLSEQESKTGFSMTHPSSVTLEISTPDTQVSMLAEWIGSVVDSHVNRFPLPDVALARPMNETFGQRQGTPLASFDRDTLSWKMYQGCLLPDMNDDSSLTWPHSGMIANGMLSGRVTLEHHSEGIACGFSVPCPVSADHKGAGRDRLERGANNNLRDYFAINYNLLYPPVKIIEWLCGWPTGWSGLRPLEMDGFRKWLSTF